MTVHRSARTHGPYSTLLQPAMPKVIVLLASPLTDMLGEPVRSPGDDAGDDT
jgi:hypothetical protein